MIHDRLLTDCWKTSGWRNINRQREDFGENEGRISFSISDAFVSLKKTTSLNAFRVAEILSKSIWEYMGVYGSIWEYMGVYGSVWEYGSRCTGVHRYSYSPAPTPNPNPNNIVEYRTTSSPSLDDVIAANARTYISRQSRRHRLQPRQRPAEASSPWIVSTFGGVPYDY
jgi:hypothetical protein